MKILNPLIFLVLILLGVFALANWTTLNTPTSLSFLIATVEAPLGLILLGVTLVFVALFAIYVAVLRTTMLIDARRYSQELRSLQDLAQKAEASRVSELRGRMDQEFAQLREAVGRSQDELKASFAEIEAGLRKSIEDSAASLSAYVGEVEDKLDRMLAARAERQ